MKTRLIIVAIFLLCRSLYAFPPTNTIVKCEFAIKGTNTPEWIEVDLEEGRRFIGSMPYFGDLKDWNPWRDGTVPKTARVSPANPHFYFQMTTVTGKKKTASFTLHAGTVEYLGLGLKLVPESVRKSVLHQLEQWEAKWNASRKINRPENQQGLPTKSPTVPSPRNGSTSGGD